MTVFFFLLLSVIDKGVIYSKSTYNRIASKYQFSNVIAWNQISVNILFICTGNWKFVFGKVDHKLALGFYLFSGNYHLNLSNLLPCRPLRWGSVNHFFPALRRNLSCPATLLIGTLRLKLEWLGPTGTPISILPRTLSTCKLTTLPDRYV